MYKSWQFLLVALVTGLFTGLTAFVVYLALLSFMQSIFSPINLLMYLLPFIGMWVGAIWLRQRYNYGMLSFGQGFRISFATGFVAALVFSVLLYYLFEGPLAPVLNRRVNTLVTHLVLENPTLGIDQLNQRKQLIQLMLTPLNQAVYFFGFNFIILPISCFLIAIFARKRGRLLDMETQK